MNEPYWITHNGAQIISTALRPVMQDCNMSKTVFYSTWNLIIILLEMTASGLERHGTGSSSLWEISVLQLIGIQRWRHHSHVQILNYSELNTYVMFPMQVKRHSFSSTFLTSRLAVRDWKAWTKILWSFLRDRKEGFLDFLIEHGCRRD